MTPYVQYLLQGSLPTDPDAARKIRVNVPNYTIINGALYRKGYMTPWLRCITKEEGTYVIEEVHAGICGAHTGARSVTFKILRAGYFWPTMSADTQDFIRKCRSCQVHSNIPSLPQVKMTSITSPWPFLQWGIDIVGPLPGAGNTKFLIVAVDYFTKWVEAQAVPTITGKRICQFVWRQIVCRFGLPHTLVTDNGRQLTENPFKQWCVDHCIKQNPTSVAYPQANGQTEVTNRTIVHGLKTRLEASDGNWVDELPSVLWAYRTTPRAGTKDTPFGLVYGTEAVVPVEVALPSNRVRNVDAEANVLGLQTSLCLVEERREAARIKQAAYKSAMERHYNSRV